MQWVAGILIRARGSGRLLSPLTSPTLKLQSGKGAEARKGSWKQAQLHQGLGREGLASAASPLPHGK